MKLRKIISGGQTGADRAGLEEAKRIGLETGGYAPRGYRTEAGPDPSLKDFGLVETASDDYPTRTRLNAKEADCTIWFGKTGSPGFYCTKRCVYGAGAPLYINPDPTEFKELCDRYEVINIAGNRKSKNPEVVDQVRRAFAALKE